MAKEKVRMRGHHIDIVCDPVNSLSRKLSNYFTKKLYGSSFSENLKSFHAEIGDDTLVEVVDGLDDVCEDCNCPYAKHCKERDYKSVGDAMIKKNRFSLFSLMAAYVKKELKAGKTPDTADADFLKEYGLEVGETYRFGDIKFKEEKND